MPTRERHDIPALGLSLPPGGKSSACAQVGRNQSERTRHRHPPVRATVMARRCEGEGRLLLPVLALAATFGLGGDHRCRPVDEGHLPISCREYTYDTTRSHLFVSCYLPDSRRGDEEYLSTRSSRRCAQYQPEGIAKMQLFPQHKRTIAMIPHTLSCVHTQTTT